MTTIHPMAALHVRGMDQYEAITAALSDPDNLIVNGGEPGNEDAYWLVEAARAFTYVCPSCGDNLAYDAYTKDSNGCGGLCEICYDEAGEENSLSDGHIDEAQYDADMAALAKRRRERKTFPTVDEAVRPS